MAITAKDVRRVHITDDEVDEVHARSSFLARTIQDRKNLHDRSYQERLTDIEMGEFGELACLKYFHDHGKYAVSAVDKTSGRPDAGFDLILRCADGGKFFRCSVKTSLSVFKSDPEDIIATFQLGSTPKELSQVNIQVYFYYNIHPKKGETRVTVLTVDNLIIVGWIGLLQALKMMGEGHYTGEDRPTVDIPLRNLNPMDELLEYLS